MIVLSILEEERSIKCPEFLREQEDNLNTLKNLEEQSKEGKI